MRRILFLAGTMLLLSACGETRDISYYGQHPAALQQAMYACPAVNPEGVTCDALMPLAREMQQLTLDLRRNPQQFGQQIIALQNTLATSTDAREKTERELTMRLALVKWLLSPGGQS